MAGRRGDGGRDEGEGWMDGYMHGPAALLAIEHTDLQLLSLCEAVND